MSDVVGNEPGSATTTAAPGVVDPGRGSGSHSVPMLGLASLRRPVVAALVLLLAYGALSLLLDPHGFLGTDTGGKVATLASMQAHDTWTHPDVGYWAEAWDPTGRVHGLIYTAHIGDQWINVTSFPMVLLGEPLWRLGGYRAALLLPMLGGVACAFVARGFERRLRGGEGWASFWIIGLASPVTVYALDFWEHSIGLALIAGGVLVLLGEVIDRPAWWRGVAAGGCFGAAFSMRTEALVYGVVGMAVTLAALLFEGRATLGPTIRRVLVVGASAGVGFAALFQANSVLEKALLGQTFRSGRAVDTAAVGGSVGGLRIKEALATATTPFPTYDPTYVVLGVVLAVMLVVWARRSRAGHADRVGVMAATIVGGLLVLRLSFGLGFWPGLLATTPIAAIALANGWGRRADRLVLAYALIPLPLVFAFQFPGGALPQWAGRYLLPTGLLLGALGASLLVGLVPWARRGFVVVAVVATAAGVGWLSVRSHEVAAAGTALESRPEAVLISADGFPAREFGATYGRKPWLAVSATSDIPRAIGVAVAAGAPSFAVVALDATQPLPPVPGFHETGRESVPFVGGQSFTVTSFDRD